MDYIINVNFNNMCIASMVSIITHLCEGTLEKQYDIIGP